MSVDTKVQELLKRELTAEEQDILSRALAPFVADVLQLVRHFGADCEPVGYGLATVGIIAVLSIVMEGTIKVQPEKKTLFLEQIDRLRLVIATSGEGGRSN